MKKTRYLTAQIERAAVDAEERTVSLSFSSEQPVDRFFGVEVLSHEPGAVRMGRLNNGGALLVDHDRQDQVGVVISAQIDADRKGRAIVKFGRSARSEEIFNDVMDGIRRLVSVGYRVHKTVKESTPGGGDLVKVTDWEPFEISIVSVPADETVGVGRDAFPPADFQSNTNKTIMSDQSTQQPITAQPVAEVARESAQTNDDAVTRAMNAERARISTIHSIADQAKMHGVAVDSQRAIADGQSADAFQAATLNAFLSRNTDYTPSDLSDAEARDVSRFDLGTAIRSMVNGTRLTGAEREMVQEGEREAQRAGLGIGGGITLPSFLVRRNGRRDMTTTAGQGGHTVATVPNGLLDDFFAASIMAQLGATVLPGLSSNVTMPRLTAGATPSGKGENDAASEVSPTTSALTLSPKRLPAFIDLSQQLLMQSSVALESMIRGHLTNQLLAVQEAAFFHGTGTDEALGLAATSGIGSVAGGTNGAAPTYAHLVALEAAVDTVNALTGGAKYATNGQIRAKLKNTPKQSSGVEGNFVLSDLAPNTINGYGVGFTNAISRTLTKGSSSACSAIFFGNFADYVIGYWGGLQLELVRDSAAAKNGIYTLVANTFYDGGVVRPKSFAAMLDAIGA